ncbi:MAG: sulfotransferase domain-containing protein [Candidatus Thiodiazotropha sp. (ex Monitilora ramsayi)]|nr:sulfotransferase domain-containing protein [Candidatus Thiodiazotropha sp. (ex Monitilora ramsayi)]
MIKPDRLPDFYVIGTQKAGTTTLHDRLSNCNLVNLPDTKETHFFSDDSNYMRGVEWYIKQFPPTTQSIIRGEIAPDYLFSIDAPSRIHELTPTPNIIAIFRNPLERAHSNYLMAVRNGYENMNFHEALSAEASRISTGGSRERQLFSYLGRSLYADQLKHFHAKLPKANYLYLKFEDFTDTGAAGVATYRKICDFIGVPECAEGIDLQAKSNVASQPRSTFLRDQLYNPSLFKRILRFLIPSRDLRSKIAYRLDIMNQRPVSKSEISSVPEFVIARLIDDLEQLQLFTNLDLTHWKDRISRHNQGK